MSKSIEQAVIIAGGMGTRLKPFTDTNPKPMYPFEGIPFIEYLVKQIKSFGINNILILVGYLPEKIMDYLGDGSKYGVKIDYDITPVEYETADRVLHARNKLADEYLFMYCDNYCPIDYRKLVSDYCQSGAMLQFTAYANLDGYTKNNLKIVNNGKVEVYDKKRITEGLQGVDIGYAIVNKKALDLIPQEGGYNLEAVLYPELVKKGLLYATVTEHRYYSVGSFERIELTKAFFNFQKYIFLDRDGTLNVRPPKACYIERPEDFKWLPGAREAVKKLNDAGYRLVLISNQPGIARGNLTEKTLSDIHQKMQDELMEIGAHIDHIYYCPHNWDDGCACRKPKPGMFYQAQKDMSIDLTKAIMIGDDERDIDAGNAAGCKESILVSDEYTLMDAVNGILAQR